MILVMNTLNFLSLVKIFARMKKCINVFCCKGNVVDHAYVSDQKFQDHGFIDYYKLK